MRSEWISFLPQLILAAGGLSIFAAGALLRNRPPVLLFTVALLSSLAAGAAAGMVAPQSMLAFQGMLAVSSYSSYFTLLIAGITFLVLLFVHPYGSARGFAGDELYGLLLFSALGMSLVASAPHWVTFFLGLELLSLPLFVLIAIRRDSAVSAEAGLKYFIMGAVASAFLVFGIALLYAVSGTLRIAESLGAVAGGGRLPGTALGIGLVLVGIGFKISMVPFHLWTPDVYQGAPAPIAAFLSTGSKVALFSALLRLALSASPELWNLLIPLLWALAALTMFIGNITALLQTSVKRLLAYSSVAQMGYLLMALLALRHGGGQAVMFYLTAFALMDLGAFGSVAALSPKGEDLDRISDYQGIGYTHAYPAALLAASLLSLAGFPPTVGFVGKFILFAATLKAGFVMLAVIGILTAIISIYFYLKVVVALYMQPQETSAAIPEATLSSRLGSALVLFFLFALGILPSPLLDLLGPIVVSLRTAAF